MNNKGQTLVMFIIFLPVILILVALLINYSFISNLNLKLENNIKSAISYGLNLKINDANITNDEVKDKIKFLIDENLSYESLDIKVNDNSIEVSITSKTNGFINNITNFNNTIKLNYYGNIENQRIKIERR